MKTLRIKKLLKDYAQCINELFHSEKYQRAIWSVESFRCWEFTSNLLHPKIIMLIRALQNSSVLIVFFKLLNGCVKYNSL